MFPAQTSDFIDPHLLAGPVRSKAGYFRNGRAGFKVPAMPLGAIMF
jgi:hypothetical protein